MFKTKTPQKTFRTEEVKKQHQFRYCILLIFIIIAACGNNRRPGLSDKDLFAQRKVDTLQESEQFPDFSDMETYVIPSGVKYKESRAVDPANPPVVLDIANRNLNLKKFNLSDYYTQVRYVKLKHPSPATEGNFLLDARYRVTINRGIGGGLVNSQFKITDNYIIAGDISFGFHCYDKEGTFLYTIESNDFPKIYDASTNETSFDMSDFKGLYGGVTTYGNHCLYYVRDSKKDFLCLYDLQQKNQIMTRSGLFNQKIQNRALLIISIFNGKPYILDHQSMADYVYDPVNAPDDLLLSFDLKGDTLCRFPNYNPIPVITGNYPVPIRSDIYYYDKQLTIRQTLNDTVYRVIVPNRLLPAFVLDFGTYRADVQTFFRGNLSEKLLPNTWKEADQFILCIYTQNRDMPNNRTDGSVKFFYSYYDKKSRQFYHISEGTSIPPDQFFMENPIPDALPFVWSYAETEDQQLRVVYSKKRLEEISKTKEFASLSPEQQNKLKTMQDELDDNEVLVMILE